MNQPFFADNAIIELQGEQSLNLIEANYSYALYELSGFTELRIYIADHRAESVLALHQFSGSEDLARFMGRFNTPAFVLVTQAGERTWLIDLYEAEGISPINTVEIGVGIPGPLPVHQYDFYHYEPAGQDRFHFFSIYQNDPEPFPAFPLVPAFAEI